MTRTPEKYPAEKLLCFDMDLTMTRGHLHQWLNAHWKPYDACALELKTYIDNHYKGKPVIRNQAALLETIRRALQTEGRVRVAVTSTSRYDELIPCVLAYAGLLPEEIERVIQPVPFGHYDDDWGAKRDTIERAQQEAGISENDKQNVALIDDNCAMQGLAREAGYHAINAATGLGPGNTSYLEAAQKWAGLDTPARKPSAGKPNENFVAHESFVAMMKVRRPPSAVLS